jgi:hypothetical protein
MLSMSWRCWTIWQRVRMARCINAYRFWRKTGILHSEGSIFQYRNESERGAISLIMAPWFVGAGSINHPFRKANSQYLCVPLIILLLRRRHSQFADFPSRRSVGKRWLSVDRLVVNFVVSVFLLSTCCPWAYPYVPKSIHGLSTRSPTILSMPPCLGRFKQALPVGQIFLKTRSSLLSEVALRRHCHSFP